MTPAERGDLAESLVPVAAELTFLVRDECRETIGEWLDQRGIATEDETARALIIVLAAFASVDTTPEQALAWVTWDERGQPLDGTIPLLPAVAVPGADLPAPERRRMEYAGLRAQGLTEPQAAARMGLHRRTVVRYEAQLKAEGLATWTAREDQQRGDEAA